MGRPSALESASSGRRRSRSAQQLDPPPRPIGLDRRVDHPLDPEPLSKGRIERPIVEDRVDEEPIADGLVAEAELGVEDPAEVALLHQLMEIAVGGEPAPGEERQVLHAHLFGALAHLLSLLGVEPEGLFAEHVQARVEGVYGHRVMPVVRRGDDQGVELALLDQLAV